MKTKVELYSAKISQWYTPMPTVTIRMHFAGRYGWEIYFNKDVFRCTKDPITSAVNIEKVSEPYMTFNIYDGRNKITVLKYQVKLQEKEYEN